MNILLSHFTILYHNKIIYIGNNVKVLIIGKFVIDMDIMVQDAMVLVLPLLCFSNLQVTLLAYSVLPEPGGAISNRVLGICKL